MGIRYGKFEMPTTIKVEKNPTKPNCCRFIAEPFERGFGHTIGNSMRRMLLTSLEAPAIISVRLGGVPHEYMAIDGIIEDMTNIILNLKGALLRKLPTEDEDLSRDTRILTNTFEITQDDLDANDGHYKVTLKDVISDSNFEIINPDLALFTVTKPMVKQADFRVAFGRGYQPSERHVIEDKIVDEIFVDSTFSPVTLVNYFIENTRVGQDTDFDRLILEVHTDGRITPVEALSFAAQIGVKHFSPFQNFDSGILTFEEENKEVDSDQSELLQKLLLRIDEIELSVRSTNCLVGANIETIAELVSIPEKQMLEFRNFGKKSLNEIKAKLVEMELGLGMDLSKFGITYENVKEKVVEYLEIQGSVDQPETESELEEATSSLSSK